MKREVRWGMIPPEQKKLYVRLLLADGYPRTAIGAFFCATKNAVVGFQHSHLPKLTGKKGGTKMGVTSARLEQLLQTRADKKNSQPTIAAVEAQQNETPTAVTAIIEPVPEPISAPEVSTKLTTDWRLECQHAGGCAYMRLPGTNSCGRPGHDK